MIDLTGPIYLINKEFNVMEGVLLKLHIFNEPLFNIVIDPRQSAFNLPKSRLQFHFEYKLHTRRKRYCSLDVGKNTSIKIKFGLLKPFQTLSVQDVEGKKRCSATVAIKIVL